MKRQAVPVDENVVAEFTSLQFEGTRLNKAAANGTESSV
jgi:hypothetical protein